MHLVLDLLGAKLGLRECQSSRLLTPFPLWAVPQQVRSVWERWHAASRMQRVPGRVF